MRLFRKKGTAREFDTFRWIPALKRSICTGEMTFGYIAKDDGSFHGLQLVPEGRLDDVLREYGIRREELEEIW